MADSQLLVGAGPGEILRDEHVEKTVKELVDRLLIDIDIGEVIAMKTCPVNGWKKGTKGSFRALLKQIRRRKKILLG